MTDTHPLIADGPIGVLVPRDIVMASGPDAEMFLQGQVSQDVAALDTGASAWSFILQPQGKVDAWFRVSRTAPDSFVLDIDAGHGDAVVERLNRFKLRTKVDFEQHSWEMLAVRGAASGFEATARVTAAPEWPGMAGVDLLGPVGSTAAVGVRAGEPEDLEVLRIWAGVPAMGSELHAEVIPAEAGVVPRSVSFTKGCFTGQELVARIDSRGGNVPRRLRLVVADTAISAGEALVVDGVEVGLLTSVANDSSTNSHVGLAYVKRVVDPSESPVAGSVTDREVQIKSLVTG